MEIDRRTLLSAVTACCTAALTTSVRALEGQQLFAAARREADGTFAAAIFDLQRGDVARVALPARGHDAVGRPGTRSCVMFARRPGNFAVAFSADHADATRWFSTPAERHFYGHGVFSPDGRLLYATENDIASGQGVIGIRDATDEYKELGQFPAYGIGPHDIALLPDGRTIVVANGGIETHPDSGRAPLNLATMSPSLAYIDRLTGELLERHSLSATLHKLSIRHLAGMPDGGVVFGCQHRGPKVERPQLVGVHRRGGEIRLLDMPATLRRDMQFYISSIDVDRCGDVAVATSARGGLAVVLDIRRGKVLGRRKLKDVSGVAGMPYDNEIVLTDGHGRVSALDLPAGTLKTRRAFEGVNWDNHMAALARS